MSFQGFYTAAQLSRESRRHYARAMDMRRLITRLTATVAELRAEGNHQLAAKVEQAIRELEAAERPRGR